jgi:hypothetical protein
MLEHSELARDALLTLFLPDGQAPWTLNTIEPEHRVGRHRVDLRVDVTDANGRESTVLIETKVNDAVSESQLATYCGERAEVVLYAPGLTGLLLANGNPAYRELWVTGAEVTRWLKGVDLPDLLSGYVDEVAFQAARMDAARGAARGDDVDFPRDPGISGVSGDDVEAVAWIAEIAVAMRGHGAKDVRTRNTRHDYGVFWGGIVAGDPGPQRRRRIRGHHCRARRLGIRAYGQGWRRRSRRSCCGVRRGDETGAAVGRLEIRASCAESKLPSLEARCKHDDRRRGGRRGYAVNTYLRKLAASAA